jgi:hypothetical protein
VSTYHIIDEPKVKIAHRFIVNPTAILLAAIFIPIVFQNIPLYGRFWLPFVWLMLNGYLLGSPSFWRECFYAILGLAAIAGTFWGFGYAIAKELISAPNTAAPYLRVLVNGIYFTALYLVVFTQNVPFSIYSYVKQQSDHG